MLDGLVVEPEEGVQRTALLQLSHGMSEYKERYLPFMEFMAEHGVVCVIHDHRGHGKSVKSEQDLGFMYGAGGVGLVEDLFLVTKWAKKEYPDLPFVLMGHSMGSLVVRAYAKEHGSPGAVRTRRWCGSMKKIRSVDLHFRMMLFLR